MHVIYKGLFTASVICSASVWYESMRHGFARELMNKCQRVTLYACLNVCKTISTDAMQILMGGLP